MPRMRFKLTIPVLERAKTFHALDLCIEIQMAPYLQILVILTSGI
jgi:hypothetical protein